MKKMLLVFFALITINAFSQEDLQNLNDQRNKITLTGMKVLGGWGIANIGAGSIGWANTDGTDKYFYQMSTIWGAVNLGIATLGYIGTKKDFYQQLDASESLKAQKKIERLFMINGGLDVAYIGTGIYLKSRGNNKDDEKLKGFGSSLLLQGIFLLAFDATMYSAQRSNGNKLRKFLENNSVSFSGNSIGLIHIF